MSQQAATIFKRLENLEQEVQKLKVQAYFNIPQKKPASSVYSQTAINRALKATRNQIWQGKYARKVKSIS